MLAEVLRDLARRASCCRKAGWGGLLFVLLFVSFDVSHPALDLMHLVSHQQSAEQPAPAPSPGGDPTVEAHGPCVLPDVPMLVPPQSCSASLYLVARGPEDRFLSPPSPVPIMA